MTNRPQSSIASLPRRRVLAKVDPKSAIALVFFAPLLLCAFAFCSHAATVTGNTENIGLANLVTNIIFTPLDTPSASRPTVFISQPATVTTDGSGSFSLILNQGNYKVIIGANPKDSFLILVPGGTNSYNWVDLTISAIVAQNVAAGFVPPGNALKGDLFAYNGSAWTNFPAGTQGQALTVNTNASFGIDYETVAGSGTVTSVALSLPNIFTVSGSPITSAGTLTGTLANQSANLVFAGPSSGSASLPTFRSLNISDLPYLPAYQPSSANLTNWSNLSTNSLESTNDFRTWTNTLGTAITYAATAFQPATANLTNWSALSTNSMESTNDFRSWTNTLGSIITHSQTDYQATNPILTGLAGLSSTNQLLFTNSMIQSVADGGKTTLKLKGYIQLLFPHRCDGTGAVIATNDYTQAYWGHALFSGSAATNANYIEYRLVVPDDIDTSVDLKVTRWKVRLSAADTSAHIYNIGMASVADSASYDSPTLGQWVSLSLSADASGASGDVETVSNVTLTSWKSNVTAGQLWVIRINRDGASDTSNIASYDAGLVLEYGIAQ